MLYIDIETEIDSWFEKNKKDLIEKRWEWEEKRLEKNWALFPEVSRIRSVWIAKDNWEIKILDWEEFEILQELQKLNFYDTFVWRNIKRFDMPFIIKKFMQHNLELPNILWKYWKKKPWEVNCIDLMEVRACWWGFSSLSSCCEMLEIENPKEIWNWDDVKEMDNETLKKYLTADVKAVREIYKEFTNLNLI